MEPGIYPGITNAAPFWKRVDRSGTCWIWTGSKTTAGYGNLRRGGRNYYAHRVAYELAVGPIPEGLVIDHLCRVRSCVNPEHLEPVTQRENIRRGAAGYGGVRTTCKRGHDITDANNVYIQSSTGQRSCLACRPMFKSSYRRNPNWPPRNCPQGHEFTPENTSVDGGSRRCKECNRDRGRVNYAKKMGRVA